MKLDKTKIFTSVTADQVPIGTVCVFGNSIEQLRDNLNMRRWFTLDEVCDECCGYRFEADNTHYMLAYIVEKDAGIMEWFDNLRLGTRLLMKEEYNEGYEYSVMVTGYDRKNLMFYAAGKWYNAEELYMFEEPATE